MTQNKKTNQKVNQKANQKTNQKTSPGKSKRKKETKFKKTIRWILVILFLLLSLSVLAGVIVFNFKYGKDFTEFQIESKELVKKSDLDTFRQTETSLVYDVNEKLTSILKGEKDVYYLDYEDIPVYAKEAMIAIEDKKFQSHIGIDIKANIRAVLALIRNKGGITQGASTITQQLARNIFLSNEVSYERKVKEIFIALELEKKYSKKLIMEFYLNNIYFANGYYGIQAASKGYFSKSIEELSLSQIAFLCAIPNNPTIYNPLEDQDNTEGRRDRILQQMYEDGMIGQEEYQSAQKEKIKIVQKKMSKNNYVETYVYYSATRALMEQQGFEFRNEFKDKADREQYDESYYDLYNQCQQSLYYEGYRIYTSIDLDKQQLLQKAVDEALQDYPKVNKEGIYSLQGAAVSVDNNTGRVVAIVGGRYQETNGYTLNRGYQSYRQPGSVIKPLIVYTPSFERGYYPDTLVVDEAIKDGPTNSNGVYAGEMELRRAVELSKNTIAWKLFEELTPQVGLSYLLNMSFAKIHKNDYYPSASLGGFTTGVSPLEMTAGFATLENDGIYRDPTCIIKILNAQGEEIVNEKTSEIRIYNSNAARISTDVLTGVIQNGTGKGLGLENMTSAGKTGTTNEKKDGWFVGYTPYYTTGVWVGYDIPKAMEQLSGSTFPGTIWRTYMNAIHKGLENIGFEPFEDNRTPEELLEIQEKKEDKEKEKAEKEKSEKEKSDKKLQKELEKAAKELEKAEKKLKKKGKLEEDKEDDSENSQTNPPDANNPEENYEGWEENRNELEIDWNDDDNNPEEGYEDNIEEIPTEDEPDIRDEEED